TGGNIPRLERLLPEPIETPRCHVTQIERRRAESPHRSCLPEECAEHREEWNELLVDVVREASDEQCVEQAAGLRHSYARPIHKSTLTTLAGEEFLPRRVVDRADLDTFVDLQRERRAEHGQT